MNATHDPLRRSWVSSANHAETDFPIQNLPFGVFRHGAESTLGVAIGDQIVDLRGCAADGMLTGLPTGTAEACAAARLNPLMSLGAASWSALRARLSDLLRADHPETTNHARVLTPRLHTMAEAVMCRPAIVGDYTDFYASIHHATNVGKLFRPDHPLLANYKYVPIGYHGRASSICISGSPVKRPTGQFLPAGASEPRYAPTEALDYEIEVGFFVGPGNRMGEIIPLDRADSHLFGVCLLNDWSARDIQSWEYQPLGPFLGKSFATTISPWIVTMEALEPFRTAAPTRDVGDPAPLPYLSCETDRSTGAIDLQLEVGLRTANMRVAGMDAVRLSRANLSQMYWTAAQLLTHHASNGCNLQPGDLLASGTVSGIDKAARGCLLELTQRGREPILLPNGEKRSWLEDEDEIILRGFCAREGAVRIGLGSCTGEIVPAG